MKTTTTTPAQIVGRVDLARVAASHAHAERISADTRRATRAARFRAERARLLTHRPFAALREVA